MPRRDRRDAARAAEVFPLSNRGESVGSLDTLPPAEIDTLGFSFLVDGGFQRQGARATVVGLGTASESWKYSHSLPGGGFVALGVGGRAWVEASMPKRACESNVHALPLAEALETARGAYEEAKQFCTPRDEGKRFELARTVRLDAVRDFDGVTMQSALLDGLAAVPVPGRWKVRRWADAERNRAESLRKGPKSWGGTLYDKHAETRGAAPEGRMRFEARMHREQLESAWARSEGVVMGQLADLQEGKVQRLTQAVFRRMGFDREVSAVTEIAERVFSDETLKDTEKAMLWAYLTAPGFDRRIHRETRYRYRDMAQARGVTPGRYFEEAQAAPITVALDFEKGREVVRAA